MTNKILPCGYLFCPLNTNLSEDWQGNILHIFAHMLDLAKSKAAFKKSIGEYKMGKVSDVYVSCFPGISRL